ncbi:MAG: DUF4340 domain-containing protein [Desulfobacterales bacterium]|nr:DUF4340 domain-containing protein [Desulfobacterales bacterium]
MKIKKEYIILVLVILILSAYLIFHSYDKSNYKLPILPVVSKKDITKIEILNKNKNIELIKKDDKWHIEPKKYVVDNSKIDSMLSSIANITLTAMVSESKNYNRYDLDNDKKIILKAWVNDKLEREIELGKTAPSYQHTFVKLVSDFRVYHAKDNLKNKFDESIEDLRDKTVLSFKQDEIREINLTKDNLKISLLKKDGKWTNPDNKKVKEDKLNSLLSTLSNLKCEKFIEDGKKESFKDPNIIVLLKGTKEYSLSIFVASDKDKKSYKGVSSDSIEPFDVSEFQADDILKKSDEFLEIVK